MNKALAGEIKAIVSDFSIDSIIIAMGRNGVDINEIRGFLRKLIRSKGISVYSINMRDRFNALFLISKYNLDYEDALVLQSAISTRSKEIVSFDKHFDNIKEIKRVEP